MTLEGRIGVLGGTFDPIHLGHLDAAQAARAGCGLDTVLLVPARTPPHRPVEPHASERDRFTMVTLAANGVEGIEACDIELRSNAPSLTAVTLERLAAQGVEPTRLFFVTGADAFAEIATWHDYPAVLDRSHFVVVARPGHPIDDLRNRLPELRARMRQVNEGADVADDRVGIWLVEAETREISSSTIRRRVASGESIATMVPVPVARYIDTHALYTASSGGVLA